MRTELFVDGREIRCGLLRLQLGFQRRVKRCLQVGIVPAVRQRPLQFGALGPLQILVDCTDRDGAAACNLSLIEIQFVSKSQDFLNLAHGRSPGRQ
jgi:hypothetical protein